MMVTADLRETFLSLVRLGIGNYSVVPMHERMDWDAIKALAGKHGLSAVIVDGIEQLSDEQRPPKIILLQWIGEVLQGYEYRSERYRKTIAEMAAFYNQHGFKMMVLKGYACSLDWPKPEHRPCGDIDIWLFGQQKEADAALLKANTNSTNKTKKFEIDNSHHHHSVFNWGEFMVENHYDFINVHHHKSNVEFEKLLKELAKDDSYVVELYGEKVYLPSPNLHALFLLKHIMIHFASEGITLRQLLDWALFVNAHRKEVDWSWLEGVLNQYGMRRLYDIFNAICIDDLGLDVHIFTRIQFEPNLKERVLQDILNPEYVAELPAGFFRRTHFKYRRWKGNAWKHELCYKESMWSAFWSGVWNHLLKPSSI
ncbi:MAG: nucleotidyltransferase family protein [Bacteroidaceae bacterium]|nr:nucleotidyltransferase family protein [Bacteroidaceae bacterium]